MRSVKLLVAMAAIAALVAGPAMAQDTMAPASSTEMAPATDAGKTSTTTTAKKHKKHKKHKKSTSTTAAPATTPAQ